jgi:hypothetical protein
MHEKDKKNPYSISISGTVGAVAFGPGAEARSSVTVGGPAKAAQGARLRATIEVRRALTRNEIASMLEDAAKAIRRGANVVAIGDVLDTNATGCAGKVEVES